MAGLLKFLTCGSVDDGKSTLIGHLLYDAKLIYADQKRALELDSKVGNRDGNIDYSLLLDGLMAEREQGITIDIAYRYFSTEKRSFIIADAPGHEEYTRNMAVGASFAQLSIILIDASKGLQLQTKRHLRICNMMGIKSYIFAVNKMDIVDYDKAVFDKISKSINKLIDNYDIDNLYIIPVSATEGDNITSLSGNMSWYSGKSLLDCLENADIEDKTDDDYFVLPIQRVCRPNRNFRGYQGCVESGSVRVGDRIKIYPGNKTAIVKNIFAADTESDSAYCQQPVTVVLDRETDVSRGSVFCSGKSPVFASSFTSNILWMGDEPLVPRKNYILRIGTAQVSAFVGKIIHKEDINTGEYFSADDLLKNEIGLCEITTASDIVFDEFSRKKILGEFILIDAVSHMTVACGTVENSIGSRNIFPFDMKITRDIRAGQKLQKPVTIWFTGLSGSGKSTLANELEKKLVSSGKHTMTLDGDNIRMGLNKRLGFSKEDRIENIRSVAEVSKLMNDAGLITLVSFISPFSADRQTAREIIGSESFIEIYVSASLEECEKRDAKGLYKKARNGQISDFTGISSPYEIPESPELTVDTENQSIASCVEKILTFLGGKI